LRISRKTDRQNFFPPSELPLNGDGSIYHLALKAEDLADTVLIVGDPGRVEVISSRFDRLEKKVNHREFTTHTGYVGQKRITALSTGIGTDNIDIVLNELDALRTINLESRTPSESVKPLRIIRIGTSGALHGDIAPGSFVQSQYAIGLDAVMHFYEDLFEEDEKSLIAAFCDHVEWSIKGFKPYAARHSKTLGGLFKKGFIQGITATACGFYGPQGRNLRLQPAMGELNDKMASFTHFGLPLANYEMESSALFGLGGALGHDCTTVCLVVANRVRNEFLADYSGSMESLIEEVLNRISED